MCSSKWKSHIRQYKDAKALVFETMEEIDAAINIIRSDVNLRGMPHDIADGKTLIVPPEAIPYFRNKGLQFKEFPVLSKDQLSPVELADLYREQNRECCEGMDE